MSCSVRTALVAAPPNLLKYFVTIDKLAPFGLRKSLVYPSSDSCQSQVAPELDGLKVTVPERQA